MTFLQGPTRCDGTIEAMDMEADNLIVNNKIDSDSIYTSSLSVNWTGAFSQWVMAARYCDTAGNNCVIPSQILTGVTDGSLRVAVIDGGWDIGDNEIPKNVDSSDSFAGSNIYSSGGNVGIGTEEPGVALDVFGNIGLNSVLKFTNSGSIYPIDSSETGHNLMVRAGNAHAIGQTHFDWWDMMLKGGDLSCFEHFNSHSIYYWYLFNKSGDIFTILLQ